MKCIQLRRDKMCAVVDLEMKQPADEQTDCIYLLPEEKYHRFLQSERPIIDHGTKHPDKPLAQYLLSKSRNQRGKVEAIYADFSGPGRMRQSLLTLLDAARHNDFPCTMLVGVPEGQFHKLAEKEGIPREQQPETTEAISQSAPALTPEELKILDEVRAKFRGAGPQAEVVRHRIVEAAASELSVLILGESGTGKEVAARLIHEYSHPSEAFVAVNCGAIPPDLFESELFGHEPNAFTGAGRKIKKGFWEQADGGTLFLDEIGDLPLDAQVKILRALQEGEIYRVGGEKPVKVEARVIAATNRDLFAMVEAGSFREDLFYRLRVNAIRMPSITESGNKLPDEIQRIWHDVTGGEGPVLSKKVRQMLAARSWVGNYRDLINFLQALWDRWKRWKRQDVTDVLPIHVKAVEEQYGPSPKAAGASPRTALEREVHRMRYMQQHAMCAEVLRALQLAVIPLTKRSGVIAPDLDTRLAQGAAELTLLLSKPHQFHDARTFHAIDDACDAARSLRETLDKGEAKARAFARRTALPAIAKGLDATFRGS